MTKKLTAAVALALLATQASAVEPSPFKTEKDLVSYGIGMHLAKGFKKDAIDIDNEILLIGLQDGMAGRALLSDKSLRQVMNTFQGEVRRKAAAENQKKGAQFLAENKAKDGVVTLASGIEYKVLKAGDGKLPTEADTIECIYRGTLLDGSEFDAAEANRPATLKVAQLIPGWKEALKLMPAGSKWEIVIPPQLAFGVRGVGSDVGPNETVVFEVELLAVK